MLTARRELEILAAAQRRLLPQHERRNFAATIPRLVWKWVRSSSFPVSCLAIRFCVQESVVVVLLRLFTLGIAPRFCQNPTRANGFGSASRSWQPLADSPVGFLSRG